MLRTVQSLPQTGLSTLGSGPARFQTTPPACYRASWQLPGPDSHRQATTSLRTKIHHGTKSQCHHRSAGRTNLRGYDPGPPMTPDEALDAFLWSLGVPPERLPRERGGKIGLYRTLLDGRRVLVLLDNANSAEQVRPLLPSSPGCFVIVTSRSRLSGLIARDGAQRITLDTLPSVEATALLSNIVGADRVSAEPDFATLIAHRCVNLPLAIRIVAERAVINSHATLADLANNLGEESRRLDFLASPDDEMTAVRTVFSWSYRSLPPEAARTFRLLGLHAGPDISYAAAAALIGSSPDQAQMHLNLLTNAHLLQESAPGRYQFHDLLRGYAAERAAIEESEGSRSEALRRLVGWFLCAMDAADRMLDPNRNTIPLSTTEAAWQPPNFSTHRQARDWCDAEHANIVSAVRQAADVGDNAVAWKLCIASSSLFVQRGFFSDWVNTHLAGLRAARLLGDRYGEGRILNGLGGAYRALQQHHAALDYLQQALSLFRETGDRREEGMALTNMGATLADLHRFEEVPACIDQALTICRETGDRRGEGIALYYIGAACWTVKRSEEAIGHLKHALTISREMGDLRHTGYILANLGAIYRDLSRFAEAIESFQGALSRYREIGDPQGEASILMALGDVMIDISEPRAAQQYWRQAFVICDAFDSNLMAEIRRRLTQFDD